MATKNISRTAIEGGRSNSWKVLTRHFEKSFRQKSRIFDEDSDYPSKVKSLNMRYYQTDHLNPVLNFLISRVGKPWNDVYSEICKRFDRRTVAGQHILQHIKDFFDQDSSKPGINGLYINSFGILSRKEEKFYRKSFKRVSSEIFDQVELFLQNRCIRRLGSNYYWLEPVSSIYFGRGWDRFNIAISELSIKYSLDLKPRFRQGILLTKSEIKIFKSFPETLKNSILF